MGWSRLLPRQTRAAVGIPCWIPGYAAGNRHVCDMSQVVWNRGFGV